jgi:hypothetical protein
MDFYKFHMTLQRSSLNHVKRYRNPMSMTFLLHVDYLVQKFFARLDLIVFVVCTAIATTNKVVGSLSQCSQFYIGRDIALPSRYH